MKMLGMQPKQLSLPLPEMTFPVILHPHNYKENFIIRTHESMKYEEYTECIPGDWKKDFIKIMKEIMTCIKL